jgi:UDP-N-acetylmuramoyl-tripeptide--D-alanyl-D-alanine ligase
VNVDGVEITLLDESYNASGNSVRAALEVLSLLPGRRIAVLGDMLELGDYADDEHRDLADAVSGVADLVFACGPHMRVMFDELPERQRGAWAVDAASLAPAVRAALAVGDVVLVKGSYGSRMRDVVAAIEDKA